MTSTNNFDPEFLLKPGKLYQFNPEALRQGLGNVRLFDALPRPTKGSSFSPAGTITGREDLDAAVFLFVETIPGTIPGIGFFRHAFIYKDFVVTFGAGGAINENPGWYLKEIEIPGQ